MDNLTRSALDEIAFDATTGRGEDEIDLPYLRHRVEKRIGRPITSEEEAFLKECAQRHVQCMQQP